MLLLDSRQDAAPHRGAVQVTILKQLVGTAGGKGR